MKRTVLLIVACAVVAAHAEQDKRIGIAVNDLTGQGIEQSVAAVISERLRVELINTGAFRVMERAEMKQILQEQGFQQTDCVDNSCIVKIGQLLGVEHMVMGTIGMVGSIYTISIRLVNVATGEVLYTASEDCRCPIEDVLTTATRNTAMKLELAIQKAIFGTLEVRSVPDNADVLVNGKFVARTNYLNERFIPGSYHIAVSKPTYTVMEKDISLDQKKKVTLTLTSRTRSSTSTR
jgi:TolB-like protein